jgi:hypothetical protein
MMLAYINPRTLCVLFEESVEGSPPRTWRNVICTVVASAVFE